MIELIIIISLFTLGFYFTGTEGQIFEGVRDWIAETFFGANITYKDDKKIVDHRSKTLHYLWKPLWGCPMCMVSIWGAVIYSLPIVPHGTFWGLYSLWHFPLIITCSCAINFILYKNLMEKQL